MARKQGKPGKFTVKDYYNEPICVGGEMMTRGEFIRQMKAEGHDQQRIDMWLFGYERGQAARQKADQQAFEKGIKEEARIA